MIRDIRVRFWAAVAFQFLILFSLAAMKQGIVWTGDTIRLQTVPVDPRSLFRGDYVILRYEISELDLLELGGDRRDISDGDTVYVVLSQSGGVWAPKSVKTDRPSLSPGQVMLRGTVSSARGGARPSLIDVEYGIESYFVPEGSGRAVERASGRGLSVDVAIDRFGRGVVRRLYIDGVPFDPAQPEPVRPAARPTPRAPAGGYPYP